MEIIEMNEETAGSLNWRLSNIEKTLAELKDVVLENKLQARDIKDLAKQQDEVVKAINSHDKRLRDLETAPIQAKAEKWQYIMDYIFKTAILTIGTIILAKLKF